MPIFSIAQIFMVLPIVCIFELVSAVSRARELTIMCLYDSTKRVTENDDHYNYRYPSWERELIQINFDYKWDENKTHLIVRLVLPAVKSMMTA